MAANIQDGLSACLARPGGDLDRDWLEVSSSPLAESSSAAICCPRLAVRGDPGAGRFGCDDQETEMAVGGGTLISATNRIWQAEVSF